MAIVVRKILSDMGTRDPSRPRMASAKAMSVVPENSRWENQSAQGGEYRQNNLVRPGKLAFDHLSFELQADQHEEKNHQRIIDPQ